MDSRLTVQEKLQNVMGSHKVYFDPPISLKMEYPCIRYSLAGRDAVYADGTRYIKRDSYDAILIDKSPISGIATCEKIESEFPYCRMNRSYVADGLHHYVYTIII